MIDIYLEHRKVIYCLPEFQWIILDEESVEEMDNDILRAELELRKLMKKDKVLSNMKLVSGARVQCDYGLYFPDAGSDKDNICYWVIRVGKELDLMEFLNK